MKITSLFGRFYNHLKKIFWSFEDKKTIFDHQSKLNKNNLTPHPKKMLEYGIGGQEVKQDASEGIADIPMNKTLFVQKLTTDTPPKPKAVYGLQTAQDVFDHYKPEVKCEFESESGTPVNETLRFNNLGDFGPKGITQQSKFLNDLSIQQDQYLKIKKSLNTNKLMQNVLGNEEARTAFLNALKALSQELDS